MHVGPAESGLRVSRALVIFDEDVFGAQALCEKFEQGGVQLPLNVEPRRIGRKKCKDFSIVRHYHLSAQQAWRAGVSKLRPVQRVDGPF